ncbi:MAG: carboxypeptidase regulatory-like domain-containing protein [Planctomycetes bacterium]|nr:carboxypeptidase regulatory-like domain-containing protein [Planctomycetota bacterium]
MVPRSWLGTLRWWPGVLVALMLAAVLAWLLSAFEETPPPARDPDAIGARDGGGVADGPPDGSGRGGKAQPLAEKPDAARQQAVQGDAPAVHATVTTAGIVVDSDDVPVPGASVYPLTATLAIQEWTFPELAKKLGPPVSTGADGRFRLECPPDLAQGDAAVIALLAVAEGLAPRQFGNIPVGASDVRLTLRRVVALSGKVVEEKGGPVEGATIVWRTRDGPAGRLMGSTRSQPDGTFLVRDLPPWGQTDVLEVSATGFVPVLFQLPYSTDPPTPVTIELTPGCEIAGRVADGDRDRPIEGAAVELWVFENPGFDVEGRRAYGTRVLQRTTTDASGTYRFAGVEPPGGKLPEGYRPQGFREIGVWVDAAGYGPAWVEVDHGGRQEIEVFRSGAIRGLVLDRLGRPMAGVRVHAQVGQAPLVRSKLLRSWRFQRELFAHREVSAPGGPPWKGIWEAVTGEDGHYFVERVGSPETSGRAVELTIESRIWPRPHVGVAMVPGEVVVADPMTNPDPPPPWIAGRTIDDTGQPIGGAVVQVSFDRVITDRDGRFRIRYPAPDVGFDGRARVQLRISHSDFVRLATPVLPDWAAREEVPFVLQRGARLVGTVVDRISRPVVGATIRAVAGEEAVAVRDGRIERTHPGGLMSSTKEAGTFSIGPLPAGPVAILVAYPEGYRGPFFARASLVAGTPSLVVTMPSLTIDALQRVDVRIRILDDESREPVTSAAEAELLSEGVRWAREKGPDGVVDFREVPAPNEYALCVAVAGFGPVEMHIAVASGAPGQEYVVTVGAAGGRIRGTIRASPEQRRFPRVVLVTSDGARFNARLDDRGHFEARGLEPGAYTVTLDPWHLPAPERIVAAPQTVVVSRGQAATVELEAMPAALLWIRLLGQECEPEDADSSLPGLPPSYDHAAFHEWKRREVSVQVRDRAGRLWYDGPPTDPVMGRYSRNLIPALRLLAAPGTYDVTVLQGGVVLGRGTATAGTAAVIHADIDR